MTTGETWLITIVGGAVAAILATGVLAAVNKAFRDKVWVPVARALCWPFTLRITTVARLRKADEALAQAARENARLRADVEKANNMGAAHVVAVQAFAKQEALEQARRTDELTETARELGRAQGRTEAMAEVAAERAVPLLKPAWRIDPLGTADAFILKNTQHSVEISNVSVNAPTGEFQFDGATQMRGKLDRKFEFYGQRTDRGRRLGVDFVVKWQDAHGDWWSQVVRLDREPRRATVL